MGSLLADNWLARGVSVAAFLAVGLASAIRVQHPILSTLVLTAAVYLFIFAFWIAARDSLRWLDPVVAFICLLVLILCSYQIVQQRHKLRTAVDRFSAPKPSEQHLGTPSSTTDR